MFRKVSAYFFLFIAVVLFHIILSKPFRSLDNSFTDIQFLIRGESKIDSSIITLYIDNAIMDSLGRVPLKWIYYAQLIDALSDLGVKAIGIDIVFDKNSPDYPTQASWLVTAIRNSGRVCVGGIFNTIDIPSKSDTIKTFTIDEPGLIKREKSDSLSLYFGGDLELPFPWLLKNAAGFGHLNFEDGSNIRRVPLVLSNMDSSFNLLKRGELIPALTLELLRIYYNLPADSISVSLDSVIINHIGNSIKIPTSNSQMVINYTGGLNSLNMYSISDFLNMYRIYSRTKVLTAELMQFKNKIVLIGLMGKRTGQYASTPFDNNTPQIAIHANALSTILSQRFLRTLPDWLTILISCVLAGLVFFLTVKNNITFFRFILTGILIFIFYLAITFALFRTDIIISLQPLLAAILLLIGSGIYRINLLHHHSKFIEKEKHSIETILNKSKQKILRLEKTLTNYENNSNGNDSYGSLINYQTELAELSSKFDDLSEYKNSNNEKIEFNGIAFSKKSKLAEVISFTKKIAPTDTTVLLHGESGTGKELIAKAIHELSDRKNNNFVTINCGAIPETLLESELFGHEEGAYTGAHKLHKGYFETADEGTIFLDEITETNEIFQTKLLRVLQSGEFNRVGGTTTLKVNLRIIAASNKNIEALVKQKKFREDLYYRLNVIKIFIPPLRSRKTDIPILTDHFLKKENAEHLKVSASAMDAILSFNWPGNIRQLENVIKRAAILAKVDNNNLIQLKYLPPEIISILKNNGDDVEERIISTLREMQFSHSSISDTATEVGNLHRSTVAEYLRGVCFREFCEHQFNFEETVASVAGSDNEMIRMRVQNKLNEYLNNLLGKINRKIPVEQLKQKLGFKFKKLPNRYHPYLNKIIEYFYNSEAELIKKQLSNSQE